MVLFPKLWRKIKCLVIKHHFIRFPLLDGSIRIMCTKCDKSFTKLQSVDSLREDYLDE